VARTAAGPVSQALACALGRPGPGALAQITATLRWPGACSRPSQDLRYAKECAAPVAIVRRRPHSGCALGEEAWHG
jgi:hypothetical protein